MIIPGVQYVKDFTEYSILQKELKDLLQYDGVIPNFESTISIISESILKACNECLYEASFQVAKASNEEVKEIKLKRAKILASVFSNFGYETKVLDEQADKGVSLVISWK